MIKNYDIYPIVKKIDESVFQALFDLHLSVQDRKILWSLRRAQFTYKLLTKRKYAYFWTIHNKYLPVVELEYPKYIRVKNRPGE